MTLGDITVSLGAVITLAVIAASVFWILTKQTSSPLSNEHLQLESPEIHHVPELSVHKAVDTPDGWFTDAPTFELERRAIFSQTWLCITHLSHFRKPGDYLSFTIADFPFFLILGKDSILRGFHNVCRHRAYNVTRKVMGSSLVLGCKYHGWSYDSKGNLTKAPQFDQVPGFKKEDNGLFQIWVRTDPNGFVFINLDADWDVFDPPTHGLNAFVSLSSASKASSYVAFWQTEADFNWKQANALLEQSGLPKIDTSSTSFLDNLRKMSYSVPKQSKIYFPSPVSALTTVGGVPMWHMTVVEPISATRSSIRRTLYTTTPGGEISGLEGIVSRLETEFNATVKQLESQFQEIKATGGSVNLSSSQEELQGVIQLHVRKERAAGKKITPALPLQISSEVNSSNCGVAERLCRELDGLADAAACFKPVSTSKSLAW